MKRLIFLLSLMIALVLQVNAQDSRDIVKRNVTVNNDLKLMNLAYSDTAFLYVKADGTVDTLGITQIINIYQNHGVKLWTETTSGVLSPFTEANDLLNFGSGAIPGINGGAGIALPVTGAGFKVKSNGSGNGGNLAIDGGDGTGTGGKIYIAGGEGTTTEGDVILGVTISEGPASTRGRVLVGTPNRLDESLMLVFGDMSVYDTLHLKQKGIKFPDGTYQATAATGGGTSSSVWLQPSTTVYNEDQTATAFVFGSTEGFHTTGNTTRLFYDDNKASLYAGDGNGQWISDNSGYYNAVFGWQTKAKGNNSLVAGNNNNSQGDYSITTGNANTNYPNETAVFGSNNTANYSGAKSIVAGSMNVTDKSTTVLLGLGLRVSADNETAFGLYNLESTGAGGDRNMLLSVGNGTSTVARSNAFSLWKSGAAEFAGTILPGDTASYQNHKGTTPLPGSIGRNGDTLYVYQDDAWVMIATGSGGGSTGPEIRAGNSSFTYSGEPQGISFSSAIGTTGNSYSLQLSLYDNSTGYEMSYEITSRDANGFYIAPLENGTYRYEYTATEIN